MADPFKMASQRLEGPVETQICSEDSSPYGWGAYDVKVTGQGVAIKGVGENETWKHFRFSDLELMNVRELLLDADHLLERYNEEQVDKLRILEEKLLKMKRAIASELRAAGRRREMRTVCIPSPVENEAKD